MYFVADRIAVAGRAGYLVPPTSLAVHSGQVSYVECDNDRSTALGLALTGRIPLAEGEITYDSSRDESLADASALVDAPGVSAPIDSISVLDAVAEELAIAGVASGRKAVRQWLRHHSLQHLEGIPVEAVPGADRLALLCALAVSRRRIRLLVLDTPDRHNAAIEDCRRIAEEYAAKGYAVVVICDDRTALLLGVQAYRVGATPELPGDES